MPWSVETPMSQRREFIEDAERGLYTMRELCTRYGIRSTHRLQVADAVSRVGPRPNAHSPT